MWFFIYLFIFNSLGRLVSFSLLKASCHFFRHLGFVVLDICKKQNSIISLGGCFTNNTCNPSSRCTVKHRVQNVELCFQWLTYCTIGMRCMAALWKQIWHCARAILQQSQDSTSYMKSVLQNLLDGCFSHRATTYSCYWGKQVFGVQVQTFTSIQMYHWDRMGCKLSSSEQKNPYHTLYFEFPDLAKTLIGICTLNSNAEHSCKECWFKKQKVPITKIQTRKE